MFKIKGTVLGVKTVTRNGQNGAYDNFYVGFQAPKTGGFEGEMETQEVQITRRQQEAGLMAAYERIKGQEVMADVFPNTFTRRDGSADVQWMFSGDGKPVGTK